MNFFFTANQTRPYAEERIFFRSAPDQLKHQDRFAVFLSSAPLVLVRPLTGGAVLLVGKQPMLSTQHS